MFNSTPGGAGSGVTHNDRADANYEEADSAGMLEERNHANHEYNAPVPPIHFSENELADSDDSKPRLRKSAQEPKAEKERISSPTQP